MVGSVIVLELKKEGETNIVTRKHAELDLTNKVDVHIFCTRKAHTGLPSRCQSGGIHANNTYPATSSTKTSWCTNVGGL